MKEKKGEKVEFYRKTTVCTKYERNINLIDDIYIYIYINIYVVSSINYFLIQN